MDLPPEALVAIGVAGAAIALIEQQEAEELEQIMMAVARVAVEEVMEIEEPGLGTWGVYPFTVNTILRNHFYSFLGDYGEAWVPITVFIHEYHHMGDPCFRKHFRMSRGVFEVTIIVLWFS